VSKYKLKCFKTTTYFQIHLTGFIQNASQKPVIKEFINFEQKKCFRQKQTDKIELTLSTKTTSVQVLLELT
jgi:ABC-type thiamine transport system substrate-binding protein